MVGKTGPGRPAGHRHPRSHHAARHDGGLDAADVPAAGRRPGGGQRRLRHDRRPGQPRDKVLRSHGLTVIELHNHLLYEQPRLYYLHFWKTGDATELAHALRAGLDQVHAPSG
ncbi:DUF1259 domain-containing protein [Streptomyces hebeiensis]|uniref:DUF1259 domain-containing protein n=1 Tax=Streptomyces hebeiensis TaxID=229486 RepID=UPI0031CE3E8C